MKKLKRRLIQLAVLFIVFYVPMAFLSLYNSENISDKQGFIDVAFICVSAFADAICALIFIEAIKTIKKIIPLLKKEVETEKI